LVDRLAIIVGCFNGVLFQLQFLVASNCGIKPTKTPETTRDRFVKGRVAFSAIKRSNVWFAPLAPSPIVLANQSPDNPVLLISLLNFGRIISRITAMNPFRDIFPDPPVVERVFQRGNQRDWI